MELKGSKTEQNLMTAFAGESQARNKYTYFASKARKEGYEQIAAIFEETANNEKEHAKLWFKLLGGIGTTKENLISAAEGENSGIRRQAHPPGGVQHGHRGRQHRPHHRRQGADEPVGAGHARPV